MIVAIVIVSAALMALFIAVAVAGNRAHDRQNADLAWHREQLPKSERKEEPRDAPK